MCLTCLAVALGNLESVKPPVHTIDFGSPVATQSKVLILKELLVIPDGTDHYLTSVGTHFFEELTHFRREVMHVEDVLVLQPL